MTSSKEPGCFGSLAIIKLVEIEFCLAMKNWSYSTFECIKCNAL